MKALTYSISSRLLQKDLQLGMGTNQIAVLLYSYKSLYTEKQMSKWNILRFYYQVN